MYKSLQACRAVAACLVVLFHLGETLSLDKYYGISSLAYPFSFGHAGVEFFFVLSGFIIFFVHSRDIGKPAAAGAFALKRAIRIYPSYWAVFLALVVLGIAVPALIPDVPRTPSIFIKSLLLLPQDAAVVGGTGAPVVAVAWTLQYELIFYGLFLLGIFHRLFAWIIPVAMTVLYYFSWGENGVPWTFFKEGWMLIFLIGCVTAALVRKSCPRYVAITAAIAGTVGFIASAAVRLACHDVYPGSHFAFGLSSAALIYGLVQLEKRGVVIGGSRLFQLLGASSYALYLIHVPVIIAVLRVCRLIHWDGITAASVAGLCTFLVCLAASAAFHLFFEKPVGKLLSSRLLKFTVS